MQNFSLGTWVSVSPFFHALTNPTGDLPHILKGWMFLAPQRGERGQVWRKEVRHADTSTPDTSTSTKEASLDICMKERMTEMLKNSNDKFSRVACVHKAAKVIIRDRSVSYFMESIAGEGKLGRLDSPWWSRLSWNMSQNHSF